MEKKESEGRFKKYISMLGPSDIVAFLGAAIGAVATIYSVVKTPKAAAVSMLITQILLLAGWVYILCHRFRNRVSLMKKDDEIQKLCDEVDRTTKDYEKNCMVLENEREHMIKQLFTISNSVKSNNIHTNDSLVKIYPMMPRGYTAVQRVQLRKFEIELYAGRKVTVE